MLSLHFFRNISLALGLLLLAGCAELYPRYGYSDRYNDPYDQSGFDELLDFGADMANIPPSSRARICGILVKRPKDHRGEGVKLRLMVGRLLSDACGDISGILDDLGSIPPGSLHDARMEKLIAIDTEVLKRMDNVSRRLGSSERRRKKVRSVLESKEETGSKKDEARLLREKLEAIRSMEKHLDESSGEE